MLGIIAYLLGHNGDQIRSAAHRMSSSALALVTLLSLCTLVARSEAVIACLDAMGNHWSRRDIHAANSLTFIVNTLNHYVSAIVRAALVKRLDHHRAPTVLQMIMIDASTMLVEGVLVVALLVISASALKLQWWIPLLAILAAISGLALVLAIRRRFERHAAFRGLEMLVHSRQRLRVAALMMTVFACQIVRTLIVLRATGLHPSLLQAAATFVAAGVLSSLFAGPGAGTAGAPLVIFGHQSVAAATAAGLILSITTLLSAIVYAALGGPLYIWRVRHARK
jgi:hypothetical protein